LHLCFGVSHSDFLRTSPFGFRILPSHSTFVASSRKSAMGDFELLKFNSDHDLARAAAEEFLAALPGTGSFSVALSGGRIARNFFSAVAGSAQASSRLKSVHFFWGDERCVPPNDPESNFAIAHELLLRPLGISA